MTISPHDPASAAAGIAGADLFSAICPYTMRQIAKPECPVPTSVPVVAAVFAKLGGRATLGAEIASEADLARVVVRRIPVKALMHVKRHGLFSDAEIQRFIVPARTIRHRKARRQPLTIDESDRLVRLTRVQSLAEDVLGDSQKASRWLREPLGELDRKTPLEVAQTEAGARLVEQILAKIDWGAAA